MATELISRNYPVSEQVLYLVTEQAISNYRANVASFTAYKPKYTLQYIDAIAAQLDAARALPGLQARNSEHESIRIEMVLMLPDVLNVWKKLKRYIATGYAEAYHDTKWNAAGWNYYEPATDRNWAGAISLIEAGRAFITDNLATLTANGNMPQDFLTTYNTICEPFEELQGAFIAAKESAQRGTQEKVNANSNLYTDMMEFMLDGQVIFEGKYEEKLFTFTDLAELVQPAGAAEAAIHVTDMASKAPVSDVEVVVVNTNHETTTDALGTGELTQLPAGKYQVKFMRDGFEDLFKDVTFEAGVRKRLDVEMVKMVVAQPVAAAQPVQPAAEATANATVNALAEEAK